jgi:glycosyltransferase involved in cell wall biosynthesis
VAEAAVAAVVVRNTASHDARVLRCARTLRSLGYDTVVLAVTSEEERAPRGMAQGIPIVRIAPRVPLPRAARLLRRQAGRGGGGGDGAGPLEGDGGATAARRLGPLARAYRLLRTLSYYRRGIAAVRRLRPRIVHCNDYNTMWIGVAAKLLLGSALVYDSHELWADRNGRSEPRWWLLACETLFLRIADRNLATSPGHAGELARRHRVAPPRVVRNVAERAAPNGNGAMPGCEPGGRPTLVYVGALTTRRGLEQAIEALPAAPGVTLRFLGPGPAPYRRLLHELAEERGVAERVELPLPVAPHEVVAAITPATAGLALIQPTPRSYALSLPNKLFEYVAAGLPVLASDVPTIRSFVDGNGVGLIAPPADRAEIARAMLEIAEPARNAGLRAAVRETASRLSWEREAEGLKQAYGEALTAAGGPR